MFPNYLGVHSVIISIVFFNDYNLPLVRLFLFHFLHVDAINEFVVSLDGLVVFVDVFRLDFVVVRYGVAVADVDLCLLVADGKTGQGLVELHLVFQHHDLHRTGQR